MDLGVSQSKKNHQLSIIKHHCWRCQTADPSDSCESLIRTLDLWLLGNVGKRVVMPFTPAFAMDASMLPRSRIHHPFDRPFHLLTKARTRPYEFPHLSQPLLFNGSIADCGGSVGRLLKWDFVLPAQMTEIGAISAISASNDTSISSARHLCQALSWKTSGCPTLPAPLMRS